MNAPAASAERATAVLAALRAVLPADVLVAGVRVLCAIARWSGTEHFVVSEGGVRYGLLRAALGV